MNLFDGWPQWFMDRYRRKLTDRQFEQLWWKWKYRGMKRDAIARWMRMSDIDAKNDRTRICRAFEADTIEEACHNVDAELRGEPYPPAYPPGFPRR
jgi:hypothetical protein